MKTNLLIIGITLSLFSYGQINLTNGLVGYWPLDGNINDLSGNNYSGTGTNVSFTGGLFGQAAYANGVNSIINFSTKTFPQSGDVSFSYWINTTIGGYSIFTENNNGYNGKGIEVSPGGFYYQLPTSQYGWWLGGSGAPINSGKWTHIVNTWESGVVSKIYVNNKLVSVMTNTGLNQGGLVNTMWFYWTNQTGNTFWYNGLLDEVRIYNRVLNSQEISTLFGVNCNNNPIPTLTVSGSGIITSPDKIYSTKWLKDGNTIGGINNTILGFPLQNGNYYTSYNNTFAGNSNTSLYDLNIVSNGCTTTSNIITFPYIPTILTTITSTPITITSPPITITLVITVSSPPTTITSVITITSCNTTITGANNRIESNVYVYPNPTNGRLSIKTENIVLDKIEVYRIDGTKMFEIDYQNEISLDNVPKGTYILILSNLSGLKVKSDLIIKE